MIVNRFIHYIIGRALEAEFTSGCEPKINLVSDKSHSILNLKIRRKLVLRFLKIVHINLTSVNLLQVRCMKFVEVTYIVFAQTSPVPVMFLVQPGAAQDLGSIENIIT